MVEQLQEMQTQKSNNGYVSQIAGTIIDVQFPREHTPNILNLLKISLSETEQASIEVAQQLGDGLVRCIAIENIFGIRRGLSVVDTGKPISVPVGRKVLGRIFNVLGDTIDAKEHLEETERWSIFREPPLLIEQKIAFEIQETGVKVIDLICPF